MYKECKCHVPCTNIHSYIFHVQIFHPSSPSSGPRTYTAVTFTGNAEKRCQNWLSKVCHYRCILLMNDSNKKIANNKNKCALWAPPATNRHCKTLWLEGTLGEILVTWKIKEAARFVMPAAEALSYIFQYGYVVPGNGMLLLQALKKIHRHAKIPKRKSQEMNAHTAFCWIHIVPFTRAVNEKKHLIMYFKSLFKKNKR